MMECTNPGLFSGGPDWLEPGEQRRQGESVDAETDEVVEAGSEGDEGFVGATSEVIGDHLVDVGRTSQRVAHLTDVAAPSSLSTPDRTAPRSGVITGRR